MDDAEWKARNRMPAMRKAQSPISPDTSCRFRRECSFAEADQYLSTEIRLHVLFMFERSIYDACMYDVALNL